jgi:hypothetical protein
VAKYSRMVSGVSGDVRVTVALVMVWRGLERLAGMVALFLRRLYGIGYFEQGQWCAVVVWLVLWAESEVTSVGSLLC